MSPPRSFEECGIRFREDTPTPLPILQTALTFFAEQTPDPYVFQALLYFLSSLIARPRRPVSDAHISLQWDKCRAALYNPYRPVFHDSETSRKTEDIVMRLDPKLTIRQLEAAAAMCTRGDLMDRHCPGVGFEHCIISRAHDWLIRCAYELPLPPSWKEWLQLMYEPQPAEVLDEVDHAFHEGASFFVDTVVAAAHTGGFELMIPTIKFWLRQVMTIVHVWDTRLTIDGDERGTMPPYAWCVAAYEKMVHRFVNDLRDPFSEYPYALRQGVLRRVRYMRVFEECWGWVCLATRGVETQEFDPFEVRYAVYRHVLTLVLREWQHRNGGTEQALEEAFAVRNEGGEFEVVAEDPVVDLDDLDFNLCEQTSLHAGLCDDFYNRSYMTQQELDALFPEPEADYDSDGDFAMGEYELTDDVQLEAVGPRIDIVEFTLTKRPGADDFCTWCQERINCDDSSEKSCVMPTTCSDTFHAGCLDAWVNSASRLSNLCPNCKVQMTAQQRCRRLLE